MKLNYRIFLFLITSPLYLHGQRSSARLLAEVPVQAGLGYEGKISRRFSVSLQAGVLAYPNSALIVNLLEGLGTREEIVLMIDGTFSFGVVGEAGLNYNFKKNYTGVFFQVIGLHGGNTSTELIEAYFGEDISSYPARRGRPQATELYLTLQSTLYQAGILYGRRFPLPNRRLEVDAEFGLSANVASHSELSSAYRQLGALSDDVNDELHYYYAHYAFIPSVSVCLVYKFRPDRG